MLSTSFKLRPRSSTPAPRGAFVVPNRPASSRWRPRGDLKVKALDASSVEGFDASAFAAVLGYIAGAGGFSLWYLEQNARAGVEAELLLAKSRADDHAAKVAQLEAELEREKQSTKDLAMYKRRWVTTWYSVCARRCGQEEGMVVSHRRLRSGM